MSDPLKISGGEIGGVEFLPKKDQPAFQRRTEGALAENDPDNVTEIGKKVNEGNSAKESAETTIGEVEELLTPSPEDELSDEEPRIADERKKSA